MSERLVDGVRVIESPWVPNGQMIAIDTGALDLSNPRRPGLRVPSNWASMTKDERFEWAVANGAAVLVRNIGPATDDTP